jgi:pimeloyl-ACP methyl ester carboxylesterase
VTLDVPVLVLSGEFDVATPASEAERVARQLPRARHVVFPNQGHDYSQPGCAARLIVDFFRSADPAGLDTACVSDTRRPAFGPPGD